MDTEAGRLRAEAHQLTTALMDLDAAAPLFLERCAAARLGMPVPVTATRRIRLGTVHVRGVVGGTPRGPLAIHGAGARVARAIGSDGEHVVNVATGSRGDRPPATRCSALAGHDSGRGCSVGCTPPALGSLATVDIAEGRYQGAAYTSRSRWWRTRSSMITPMMWPDFIEAAARSNHAADATTIADWLDELAKSAVRRSPSVSRRVRARSCRGNRGRAPLPGRLRQPWRTPARCGRPRSGSPRVRRVAAAAQAAPGQQRPAPRGRRAFATTGAGTVRPARKPELEAIGDSAHAATADRPAGLTQSSRSRARCKGQPTPNRAAMFLSASTVDYHLPPRSSQRLAIRRAVGSADR